MDCCSNKLPGRNSDKDLASGRAWSPPWAPADIDLVVLARARRGWRWNDVYHLLFAPLEKSSWQGPCDAMRSRQEAGWFIPPKSAD